MPQRAPVRAVADAGGRLLSAATAALAAVRPAAKPLHPEGRVFAGTLERHGSAEPTGVPLIDGTGSDAVVVRTSRAVGVPAPLPDIHGLALRLLDTGSGPADVLLASTGSSRVGRFLLTWSTRPDTWPLTTLLPYRSSSGPLLLGARVEADDRYALSWARPTGPWHPFATLRVTTHEHADQDISFDPVRRQVPGLAQYDAVVRLREPAYRRARRSRG